MTLFDLEKRDSGLLVATDHQPPRHGDQPVIPVPKFNETEIRSPKQREEVKAALSNLWDALRLSSSGTVQLNPLSKDYYYGLYCTIGQALLGDDYPTKEEKT